MSRAWWLAAVVGVGCGQASTAGEGTSGGSESAGASEGTMMLAGTSSLVDGSTSLDTTAGATSTDEDTSTGEPPPAELRYDELRQKSSHNSYQRDEALIDQLVYHRVRSIELDLHVGKTLQSTVSGDWFVYHTDVVDDDTSCRLLSDCLGELRAFAQAVPEHEVVTLWLDLKDDWAEDHRPAELDAMLDAALGGNTWGPAELLAACPDAADLVAAATDPACGWPAVVGLRGRVLVALTGGDITAPDTPLSIYLQEGQRAFVAPSITRADALRTPDPRVAIYNANVADTGAITAAAAAGFVTRAWDANEEAAWGQAVRAGAHHIGTNAVNLHRDPWTITHDEEGWPFTCRETCTPVGPEPGAIVGMEVDSGDIWASADDFRFAHVDRTRSLGGEWTAMVSTVNSWVEPFAKGCLMARAGLGPGAPYFAICRPADEEPLRVQVRETAGASTQAIEHDVVPADTVLPTSVAWIRLVVSDDGLCATGHGAWQRGRWVELGGRCFAAPLTHQGLAASSHDEGPVKLLFVDPRRDGIAIDSAALTSVSVGSARGQTFEGPFP